MIESRISSATLDQLCDWYVCRIPRKAFVETTEGHRLSLLLRTPEETAALAAAWEWLPALQYLSSTDLGMGESRMREMSRRLKHALESLPTRLKAAMEEP